MYRQPYVIYYITWATVQGSSKSKLIWLHESYDRNIGLHLWLLYGCTAINLLNRPTANNIPITLLGSQHQLIADLTVILICPQHQLIVVLTVILNCPQYHFIAVLTVILICPQYQFIAVLTVIVICPQHQLLAVLEQTMLSTLHT